ncbi:MAG: hypothetical protein BWK79_15950, partial [Beggiatoa sp. IS2]
GCGIAPTDLDKIFEPFQQVGSVKQRKQGTGLGLAITKGLVEMMGGSLNVTSVLGQGSTFSISFKLPEAPTVLQPKRPSSVLAKVIGYQGKRRTVLIIDDNYTSRAVLVKILTHLGFTTLEAENGQEGLNKVRESPSLDVIITDLVMPELSGFAVIEQLRAMPHGQKVVLIAISASAFEADCQHSLELGCNAFIAKPIKFDLLLECLRIHLNLTWLYQEDTATTNALPPELATIVLTPVQANELLELSKQGDIMGICDFAKQLEQADEELATAARHIHELATQFKTREILKIAQNLLNA